MAYTTNDVQDHPYVSKLFTTISSAPPNKTEEIPTSSEDEDEEENDVQSVDLDLDADQLDNLLSTRTLKDKPCFELSDVLVISFKVQNWDEDTVSKGFMGTARIFKVGRYNQEYDFSRFFLNLALLPCNKDFTSGSGPNITSTPLKTLVKGTT